jgi:hypothetical protein
MSTRAITPLQSPTRTGEVLPLEAGDHLTRDEFERRYEATPGIKKAELVEGVVFIPPPAVRWDYHGSPHSNLIYWVVHYRTSTPGLVVGDNSSIRLDLENEPQPDVTMVIDARHGGQARFAPDGYLEGAPEFVGEVSGTSVSIDLNAKLRVYRRNGVREYLVWRVRERAIDWFALKQGEYERLPEADGIIRSEVFPGLWLNPVSLINDDAASAIHVLNQGLSTPEHADFVSRLAMRATGSEAP